MSTPAFRRMLFAVDETEVSGLALPLVAALARAWRADLHLLHIHSLDGEPARTRAGELVTEMLDALSECGIAASGQVRMIQPGDSISSAIAAMASREEADLVVVGSHGRTGFEALFAPSVSHGAAAELTIPVLVARVAPGLRLRPQRVVAAVDVFPAAEAALVDAVRAAGPTRARVRVVHVQEAAEGGRHSLESDAKALRVVEQGLAILQSSGLEADSEIVLAGGSVGKAVAEAARRFDADLVVVASRRPSDLGSFLSGSVAHDLIHSLERPVLLAHRG